MKCAPGFLAVCCLVFAGNQFALAVEEPLTNSRQLTFEGLRSGEGYFSADGRELVFQSEREADNPFYQIYLLDLETGDGQRVSPGHGKTTCSWIHPDGQSVLFASTHLDPDARNKQAAELAFRASGKTKRYSWDYDNHYDLFTWNREGGELQRLTRTKGYDAEASFSPDGRSIAFASNRHAFTESLDEQTKATFERDPSYLMEIYLMDVASGRIKRLTHVAGYDGGPFFSADGSRICWRRFSEDGATAEIFSMKLDGSDVRQLTRLGHMSWAPYFHPSGEYLIFATNKHGFGNFELYLVDSQGLKDPVRITNADGFDGLPVFAPDGRTLSWTSNRTQGKKSQIFIGDWDHAAAKMKLGLTTAQVTNAIPLPSTKAGIDVTDLRRHVEILAAPEMGGRMTGSEGERKATAYVADMFRALGLEPAGSDDSFFHPFDFVAGVRLGAENRLHAGGKTWQLDQDWRPLSISASGSFPEGDVVFAGYGIRAPATQDQAEYDSYVHLDVTDKWVLVLRYGPDEVDKDRRNHLNRYSGLRYKAMVAREKGARGLLIATGPGTKVRNELIPLRYDAAMADSGLPAISVTATMASALLKHCGQILAELQRDLRAGDPVMGMALPNLKLEADIDIDHRQAKGRNVVARIPAASADAPSIIIGAHVDHLGRGETAGSLARGEQKGKIHFGADDNASGVAGLLEIAEYLMARKAAGRWQPKRHVVFAAWSGEELGLLGSAAFAKDHIDQEGEPGRWAAYLNMDMIGRLEKELVLQGLGSSDYWAGEIERRNVPVGLPLVTQDDAYLPTDATSFYLKGVPVLSAFTGSHEAYHTPLDTPATLNYQGMSKVVRLMGLILQQLAVVAEPPIYKQMAAPQTKGTRAGLRVYLGTIPDYGRGDVEGLLLSGVSKGGPAEACGVKSGDVVVALGDHKITNIYDYTYAIEDLKIGVKTTITVHRQGSQLRFDITPGSRD